MVTLAIVGSRDLGESKPIPSAPGTYFFRNQAQVAYAFKRLNKLVESITKRERERDPDFDPKKDITVITGDAAGADYVARIWAHVNQLDCKAIAAKWTVYGKSAGMRRNPDILGPADYIVSFWDEESKGTKQGIDWAEKHGKCIKVVKYLKRVPYRN